MRLIFTDLLLDAKRTLDFLQQRMNTTMDICWVVNKSLSIKVGLATRQIIWIKNNL